jgi:hypothetical protein
LCLGKAIPERHIEGMMNRRTLLRYALWAAPLVVALSVLGPSAVFAQSEQRQRDLDREIEQKRRDRQLDMQQDRNRTQDQLQRQELERKLREQQNRDRLRNEMRRENLQNQQRQRGT